MILIQLDIVKSSLLSLAQEEFTVLWGERALFPGETCTYQSTKLKVGTKPPKSTPACTSGCMPEKTACAALAVPA